MYASWEWPGFKRPTATPFTYASTIDSVKDFAERRANERLVRLAKSSEIPFSDRPSKGLQAQRYLMVSSASKTRIFPPSASSPFEGMAISIIFCVIWPISSRTEKVLNCPLASAKMFRK